MDTPNQLQLNLSRVFVVPTTAVFPTQDIISLLAWVDHPRSIISLRMPRELVTLRWPEFFRETRHRGYRISVQGYVAYMVLHNIYFTATDARFSVAVNRLVLEEGPLPIPSHMQTFLSTRQGPILRTETRNVEGFHILDFRTLTSRFEATRSERDREEPADASEQGEVREETDSNNNAEN